MITLMPDWEERCERLGEDASYSKYTALLEVRPEVEEPLRLAGKYDIPNVWVEDHDLLRWYK